MKEQEDSFLLMSSGQREWVDTIMRSTRIKPRKTYKPTGRRRAWLWEVVRHNHFELFVQIIIVANVAIMLVYYCDVTPPLDGVGQGDCIFPIWVSDLQAISNYVFTAIYVIEMGVKLVACAPPAPQTREPRCVARPAPAAEPPTTQSERTGPQL